MQIHRDARSPESALHRMRQAVAERRMKVQPRVVSRLLELGVDLSDLQTAIETAMGEIRLADYRAPAVPFDPPGHAFVWRSRHFGCRMYLKFRLEGPRPVCVLYSLHKADY